MMRRIWKGAARRALLAALACLWALAPLREAAADSMRRYDVKGLANEADLIVVGTVRDQKTYFKDKLIYTVSSIEVNEGLKGQKDYLDSGVVGQTMQLAQVGGDISEPIPLSLRAGGTVAMARGEKVMLFLSMKNQGAKMKAQRAKAAENHKALARQLGKPETARSFSPPPTDPVLLNTPVLVGGWQGRYTIVQNQTGEEIAVQVPDEIIGFQTNQKNLLALQNVRPKKQGAPPPPQARPDSQPTMAGAETAARAMYSRSVPKTLTKQAQKLDALKADVRSFVELQAKDKEKTAGPAASAPAK